jgi:hypothetical protein
LARSGFQPGEEVDAGIAGRGGAGESHVPDRDEHGVLDGDVGFPRDAAGGDPPVAGSEVGVGVLRTGHCGRAKRLLQVGLPASPWPAREGSPTARQRHRHRLYATLECELFDQQPGGRFETRREAKLAVFDYLEAFYNPRRPQSALGQISPAGFEARRTAQAAAA